MLKLLTLVQPTDRDTLRTVGGRSGLTAQLGDDAPQASHHLTPLQPLLTSPQQQVEDKEQQQGGGVHQLDT